MLVLRSQPTAMFYSSPVARAPVYLPFRYVMSLICWKLWVKRQWCVVVSAWPPGASLPGFKFSCVIFSVTLTSLGLSFLVCERGNCDSSFREVKPLAQTKGSVRCELMMPDLYYY